MDNKESNASKQSNSAESVHSAHSQDTELIYDVGLSCDNSRNTSIMTTPSNSDSLCVNSGSPQDHSLLDFISSPNHTSSTVCSTPHESKLVSVSKRPCPNIFDEQSVIKKQKLFNDSLDSNVLRSQKDSIANRSMDSESSREELSSSQKRNLLPGSKLPNVEYAEASSSSSTEKVISSSSIESEEAGMLKEKRFPDYLRQRNDIRKNKKENRGKTFTEWVICSISYVYDSVGEEIKSISIKQMSKTDTYYDLKQPRLSLSSGSLADSSGSETNCISRQAHSTRASHSSTVSSSSSGPSHTDKQPVNQFLIPQIPDPKKHLNFKYPKTCVCQCYCTNFVDMHTKPRCFTPETSSSSSENIKPDSQDLTLSSVPLGDLRTNVLKKAISDSSSVETLMDDSLVFRSRSSIYIPASTNLPVFAKWPSNSYCYPGIVENATEEIWHKSSHLEVKFCDGTVRKILSENLFPAYLLRSGTEICFEKDDVCETAVLISIERLLNNELVCLGESQKGIGERVNIPFEKIFLSDYCYKELKKEIPTTITPRKTPKFSLSTDNLQEGKRTRKTVKFESLSPKQSGSTGRKTKGKYKRTRSAGSSSSETLKDTGGRKRFRSSSQKKQLSKKSEDQNSTPNAKVSQKISSARSSPKRRPKQDQQEQDSNSHHLHGSCLL